ncbi:MAG: ATP synthase F1 subunit epsilon [Actinobacteria bacterium]|nr:ATP synthase F1 subunit epsilon [Actinomycetota bacterium]
MPDKKIKARLVTPEKNVFEGMVDSIVVPAHSGQLGILPGHIPIVVSLSMGILKLGTEEGPRYFGVQGGYLEFIFNSANILTERAVETTYEKRLDTIKKLSEKHEIVQEISEETKKVMHAVASLKSLRK